MSALSSSTSLTTSADDDWSDADADEGEEIAPPLQPRAYQIEMFQESMKQNTIVAVSDQPGAGSSS